MSRGADSAEGNGVATTSAPTGWDRLPEDIVCYLLHDFLRGSLLPLRSVSREWSRLVLRSIAAHASLQAKNLPVSLPVGYNGKVSVKVYPKRMIQLGFSSGD
jgi:hypothetical protein